MNWGQTIALVITNSIKVIGLVIAVKTVLFSMHPHDEAITLAVAGFMMTGAQFSEDTLIELASHWLGVPMRRKSKEIDKRSSDPKEK